ncbi:MAG: diheme cytochrome c-553, partial [Burkholderiaceae bacterium]|nr:diheme cytochrome c-553 [Burkholderiaceae bacterium]
MKRSTLVKSNLPACIAAAFAWLALSGSALAADAGKPSADKVARGKYLVTTSGCNDCHTPWTMGPNGPEPDYSRMLSGHPEKMELPPAPKPVGPWIVSAAATNTAWSGPWGVSFTANLTPDP